MSSPQITFNWNAHLSGPDLTPEDQQLDLFFQPGVSWSHVSGSGKTALIALLFLENTPSSQVGGDDFTRLVNSLMRWVVQAAGIIDLQTAREQSDFEALYDSFVQTGINYEVFWTFLTTNFHFRIQKYDETSRANAELQATVFPFFPDLLITPGNSNTPTKNLLISDHLIQESLGDMTAQLSYDQKIGSSVVTPTDETARQSIFEDYVNLLIRTTIQELIDRMPEAEDPDADPPTQSYAQFLTPLGEDTFIENLAGITSAFLLHGQRLPQETLTNVQSIFKLSGQMFDLSEAETAVENEYLIKLQVEDTNKDHFSFMVPSTEDGETGLVPSDSQEYDYQLSLAPASTHPLANLINGFNGLSAIPAELAIGAKGGEAKDIISMPYFRFQKRIFTLHKQLKLQRNGVSQRQFLLHLPNSLDQFLSHVAENPAISVHVSPLNRRVGNPLESMISNDQFNWAVQIDLGIKQIPKTEGEGFLTGVFELTEITESQINVLEAVLNKKAELAHATIGLLYHNSGEEAMASFPGDSSTLAFLRHNFTTNGSIPTDTIPALLPHAGDNPQTANFKFLQMLWEGATVEAGGYYFAQEMTEAQQSELFNNRTIIQASLLIEYKIANDPIFDFHNAVIIEDNDKKVRITDSFFEDNLALAVVGHDPEDSTYDLPVPAMPPGFVGFRWEKTAPMEDPNRVVDELQHLYHLLGYKITTDSTLTLPIGPQAPDEDQPTNFVYEKLVPAHAKMNQSKPADWDVSAPPWNQNPYRGISTSSQLTFNYWWQDIYGNQLGNDTVPKSFPFRYTDPLIGINQWPSLNEQYQFRKEGDQICLEICLSFSITVYEELKEAGEESRKEQIIRKLKGDLFNYQQVFYQLSGPGVSFEVQSSLDADWVHSFQTSTLDLNEKNPTSDGQHIRQFVLDIYRYLDSLHQNLANPSGTEYDGRPLFLRLPLNGFVPSSQFIQGISCSLALVRDITYIHPEYKAGRKMKAKFEHLQRNVAVLSPRHEAAHIVTSSNETLNSLASDTDTELRARQAALHLPPTNATTTPEDVVRQHRGVPGLVKSGERFLLDNLIISGFQNEAGESQTFGERRKALRLAQELQLIEKLLLVDSLIQNSETMLDLDLSGDLTEAEQLLANEAESNRQEKLRSLTAGLYDEQQRLEQQPTSELTAEQQAEITTAIQQIKAALAAINEFQWQQADSAILAISLVEPKRKQEFLVLLSQANPVNIKDNYVRTQLRRATDLMEAEKWLLPTQHQEAIDLLNADSFSQAINLLNAQGLAAGIGLLDQLELQKGIVLLNEGKVGEAQPHFEAAKVAEAIQRLETERTFVSKAKLEYIGTLLTNGKATKAEDDFQSAIDSLNPQKKQAVIALHAAEGLSKVIDILDASIPLLNPGLQATNSAIFDTEAGKYDSFDELTSGIEQEMRRIFGPRYPVQFTLPDLAYNLHHNKTILLKRNEVIDNTTDLSTISPKSTNNVLAGNVFLNLESLNIRMFAYNFTQAFPDFHIALSEEKNAGGGMGNAEGSKAAFLFAVRLGGTGLSYDITDQTPEFFAVPPISTTLFSGKAKLFEKLGTDDSVKEKEVEAIDPNVLARGFLESLEDVLEPDLLVPASRLDAATTEAILKSKLQLAGKIAQTVVPILEGGSLEASRLSDAREAIQQRLLDHLVEGYDIESIVQYEAAVTKGSVSAPAGDHSNGGQPPRMVGKAKVLRVRVGDDPDNRQLADKDDLDYALSAGYFEMDYSNSPSSFTYLFDTKTPEKFGNLEMEMEFQPLEMEFNLVNFPEDTSAFESSNKLQFILPADLNVYRVSQEMIDGIKVKVSELLEQRNAPKLTDSDLNYLAEFRTRMEAIKGEEETQNKRYYSLDEFEIALKPNGENVNLKGPVYQAIYQDLFQLSEEGVAELPLAIDRYRIPAHTVIDLEERFHNEAAFAPFEALLHELVEQSFDSEEAFQVAMRFTENKLGELPLKTYYDELMVTKRLPIPTKVYTLTPTILAALRTNFDSDPNFANVLTTWEGIVNVPYTSLDAFKTALRFEAHALGKAPNKAFYDALIGSTELVQNGDLYRINEKLLEDLRQQFEADEDYESMQPKLAAMLNKEYLSLAEFTIALDDTSVDQKYLDSLTEDPQLPLRLNHVYVLTGDRLNALKRKYENNRLFQAITVQLEKIQGVEFYSRAAFEAALQPTGKNVSLPPYPLFQTFVDALLSEANPNYMGRQSIPIPLRYYPQAPSLVMQVSEADESSREVIRDLREWRYSLIYEHLEVAQDSIDCIVRLNEVDDKTLGKAEAGQSPAPPEELQELPPLVNLLLSFHEEKDELEKSLQSLKSEPDEDELTGTLKVFQWYCEQIAKEWRTIRPIVEAADSTLHERYRNVPKHYRPGLSDLHLEISEETLDYIDGTNEALIRQGIVQVHQGVEREDLILLNKALIDESIIRQLELRLLIQQIEHRVDEEIREMEGQGGNISSEQRQRMITESMADLSEAGKIQLINEAKNKMPANQSWNDLIQAEKARRGIIEISGEYFKEILPELELPGYMLEVGFPIEHPAERGLPKRREFQYELDEDNQTFFGDSSIPDRKLSIENLDLLQQQNAWASIWLSRNKDLVMGRTTNEAFIFRTPAVRFTNRMTPSIVNDEPWDVATLPGGTTPMERSLAQHMDKMLDLFEPGVKTIQPKHQRYELQVSCRYAYTMVEGSGLNEDIVTTLPVLLGLRIEPKELLDPGGNGPAPYYQRLSEKILAWFEAEKPVRTKAFLQFSLEAYSQLDPRENSSLPLLRVKQLNLSLAQISELKPIDA